MEDFIDGEGNCDSALDVEMASRLLVPSEDPLYAAKVSPELGLYLLGLFHVGKENRKLVLPREVVTWRQFWNVVKVCKNVGLWKSTLEKEPRLTFPSYMSGGLDIDSLGIVLLGWCIRKGVVHNIDQADVFQVAVASDAVPRWA